MKEQKIVQSEQPVDILFTLGMLMVQHHGRELRVECTEIGTLDSNKRTLFSISYSEADTGERNHISFGGSIGISRGVALFGLSESIRSSILKEIVSGRTTPSPEGRE